MSSTRELWHDARHPPQDPVDVSFKDKTVLVTGAHGTGLGHHAAIKYAALGANPLILAVRTQEKGEEAKLAIMEKIKCSPDIFVIEILDLSSFSSIKAFADRINSRFPAIYVLQNSGGVTPWTYEESSDGYEMSLQVDVLSPILLSLLLLPKLRGSSGDPAHISFLDSIAIFEVPDKALHLGGQTLIQRCDDKCQWDRIEQYYLVKLATWYAVQGVARKCKGSEVVVNATCPGLCKTNMIKDLPLVFRMFMAVRYFFLGRSAEQGSRSLVSATTLGPDSHGKFWNNDKYHE
ncbi:putative short-chain dehydrogenase reductase protein [Rosellinia necatrix]|uniref:Putative short-chain dehydrogenase reductase protein n=1 Tax=Rosellinia necatrix TaxID=77044 RepID=A0A1W2TSH5_ROSNE|nr:putative short-chain dehydrogenase reductase protein [Rosellinia necatrix]